MKTFALRQALFAVCCLFGAVMTVTNSGCEGSGDSDSGGSGGQLTKQMYDAIRGGMNYGDVVNIIGRDADLHQDGYDPSADGSIPTMPHVNASMYNWVDVSKPPIGGGIGVQFDAAGRATAKTCLHVWTSDGQIYTQEYARL